MLNFSNTVCKLALVSVMSLAVHAMRGQGFVEISGEVGIEHLHSATAYMGGGCAWLDFNNDGWEDLYVTGGLISDRLYRNNGDGSFSDVTAGSGLEFTELANTMGVCTGDVDRDGNEDIFVITWRSTTNSQLAPSMLFINQGNGLFFEQAEEMGITEAAYSVGGSMIDVNGDGWLDLYSGNYVATPGFLYEDGAVVGFDHECYEDWIYINNQDGTFTEMAAELNATNDGCTLAVAGTNYDRDEDVDLMIINDFGQWVLPNQLFEYQNGGDTLINISAQTAVDVGLYGMGVAVGDYDEDLDLDYYVTNLGRNVLL
ncbi:MAG: VCBS repeat-containing protein, partial [Flavobacteriales bacterium]|nr:VCBS repeat-containing protein [Flavobacteriales bacterium]